MEFVWLLIGFVIGLLVAWYFLGTRHSQQLAKREAELREETQRANEDLERLREAHETTKQNLSEAQVKEASAVERAQSLEAGLSASRDDLERLSETHETVKQRLSDTETKEASAAAQIELLETDLKTRGEEMKRVKAAAEASRSQLNQQQSTIDDLKVRLSTAETARAQIDQQLKQAQAERGAADDDRHSQVADLEARIRERDEKITRLEAGYRRPPGDDGQPEQRASCRAVARSGVWP